MLKNIVVTLVLLLMSQSMFAQTNFDKIPRVKPDFEKIKADTYNRDSEFYYPRLMAEFQRNDTTMKLDKYRYLYLGYTLQEDYNPYRSAAVAKSTAVDIERARLTKEECAQVIEAAKAALEKMSASDILSRGCLSKKSSAQADNRRPAVIIYRNFFILTYKYY